MDVERYGEFILTFFWSCLRFLFVGLHGEGSTSLHLHYLGGYFWFVVYFSTLVMKPHIIFQQQHLLSLLRF